MMLLGLSLLACDRNTNKNVTLQTKLDSDTTLSEEAKALFNALQQDGKVPELGELEYLSTDRNGFKARFSGGDVESFQFQTYDAGDKRLVVLSTLAREDDATYNDVSWYYQNGQFIDTTLFTE